MSNMNYTKTGCWIQVSWKENIIYLLWLWYSIITYNNYFTIFHLASNNPDNQALMYYAATTTDPKISRPIYKADGTVEGYMTSIVAFIFLLLNYKTCHQGLMCFVVCTWEIRPWRMRYRINHHCDVEIQPLHNIYQVICGSNWGGWNVYKAHET
jgi:hypothetical protein